MHEFDTIFGKLQIFEVGDQFDCAVLTIESGKETSRHYDKKRKVIEVILDGEIVCGNKILKTGDVNIRETNQVHRFKNESKSPVKILVITVPPFR